MANFPINQILQVLNNASIQQKQPAIYQAIKQLIEASRNNQTALVTVQSAVNSQLTNSLTFGTAADRANYKPQTTAGSLVFFFETDTQELYVFAGNAWYPVGASPLATYLTATDESSILPNSRQLLAGTGITFNDTVANKRTISATGVSDLLSPFLLMGG
jgi:hypothetical protein